MSLQQETEAELLDVDLGEEYYGGSRQVEDRLTNEIATIIEQFIDRRFAEGRRPALRDAHAKDNGCVQAVFRVDPDLAPQFRHGVFIPGMEYQCWIRFSNANSEIRGERVPDARGMAIKLLDVDGPKLLRNEPRTQDFILVNHPAFFVSDLQRYKDTLVVFHSGGQVRQLLSLLKLKVREILLALRVNLSFVINPLSLQYWSMTPYRLGTATGEKMAVKYTAKPRLPPASLWHRWASYFAPNFSLRREIQKLLTRREVHFDFYVQPHVGDQTPIEDATVVWPESIAPVSHVAKLIIPTQDLLSFERSMFCENLSFNPWHCLAAHKPLGVTNRVRRTVYLTMSQHRHRLNGTPISGGTRQ